VTADLLYSDTERELAAALRSVLTARCGWKDVLALDTPWDAGLWREVAAGIGCAGLLIPEPLGGAGASYREVAAASEELGAFVAPVPFLGSSVVATAALLALGDDGADVAPGLLRRLASGELAAALAVPFTAAPQAGFPVAARVSGSHQGDAADGIARLRGRITNVADALPAEVLLVPAEGVPRGLYLVEASAPGLERAPVVSLDMTRPVCDLTFTDVPARQIAYGAPASKAVTAGLAAGAAVLAAEQLGVAQRCLDMTVGYVKERRQFARPVGSFQAIKHRLADVWAAVTQARTASRYAAACLADGDPDAPVAIALAKSACSDAALLAAQEAVQLHGGIGFTWEHPAHLYLKRAKAGSLGFGTPGMHRDSLAALADIPGPAS
jgi:alkylation response protein AidB-like acyl-CoA dehydrogenase